MRLTTLRVFLVVVCLALTAFLIVGCGEEEATTTTADQASVTTAATTATTAPSTDTTQPAKPVKIAFFQYNSTPYSVASLEGAKAEAAKLGVEIVAFNPESDTKLQATQMQDAIQTGEYQGFILMPQDPVRMQPVVVEAADKGIKVVVVDQTLGAAEDQLTLTAAPGTLTTIGFALNDSFKIWADEAIQAAEAKVGKGNKAVVGIQPGFTNFPQAGLLIDYIQKTLGATGYIDTFVMPQGEYTTPGGQKSTLDFMQTRETVDVIITMADQMCLGVVAALEQLNLVPGKDVYLVSGGANKDAVAGIKAGTWWASIGNYPAAEARLGVDSIMDSLAGKSVPPTINIFEVDGCPPAIDKVYLDANPDFLPDW